VGFDMAQMFHTWAKQGKVTDTRSGKKATTSQITQHFGEDETGRKAGKRRKSDTILGQTVAGGPGTMRRSGGAGTMQRPKGLG
jgi:hypothetical protein